VVGADGLRSLVAAAAGVARRAPFAQRAALSFHVASVDDQSDQRGDARMVVLDDGYVGLAPVPGGRLNVGIVLGASWAGRLRAEGAAHVAAGILRDALPSSGR